MIEARWPMHIAVVVAVSASPAAIQTNNVFYVQASRVALRAQPTAASTAIGFLTTNTEVRVQGRRSDWCEVDSPSTKQRGFVGCAALSRTKLTEEAIAERLANTTLQPMELLDWTARAFWVRPSLSRFLDAGRAMEGALFDLDTGRREGEQQTSLRPTRAEFEAMKQRLEAGITASGPIARSYQTNPRAEDGSREPLDKALKLVPLPAIRPSYFAENERPFALPLGGPFKIADVLYSAPQLIDALSSVHHAPFRVRVLDRARFSPIHTIEAVRGVWDLGRIGVTFGKEARLEAVTSSGRSVAVGVQSLTLQLGQDPCIRTLLGIRTQAIAGGRLTTATVGWVGKPAMEGKTHVRSQRHDGAGDYDKLIVEDIDLNGDAVPDFSVWAGRYEPVISAEGYWKAVFANVGGKWTLLAYDTDDDCT
jgi:hypothetical protein